MKTYGTITITDVTDGRGIESIVNYYYPASSYQPPSTIPNFKDFPSTTGGWFKEDESGGIPSSIANASYMWNYEIITYTDGITTTSGPICIRIKGATGNGIQTTITEYCLSNDAKTEPDSDSTEWTTDIGSLDWTPTNYIWQRDKITYTNGTVVYTGVRVDKALSVVASWCDIEEATLIDGGNIASGTITAKQIHTEAITSEKIASEAITVDHLAGKKITGDWIDADTITVDKIQASTIKTDSLEVAGLVSLRNNSICATDTIDATNIKVVNINAANITTGKLGANFIDTTGLKAELVEVKADDEENAEIIFKADSKNHEVYLSSHVVIGDPNDEAPPKMGELIKSSEILYTSTDSPDKEPGDDATWCDNPSWEDGKYIWQRTVITYIDNELAPTITTVCIQGAKGEDGVSGNDAYTVILTNESHTFAGNTSTAIASSASTSVLAYKGSVAQSVKIVSVNGVNASSNSTATGITGLSFQCSTLSGSSPTITFTCTTSFKNPNGTIPIILEVDGIQITKIFTYSIAFQGSAGAAAVSYRLETNASVIYRAFNGGVSYSPSSLIVTGKRSTGSNFANYACRWTIDVSENGTDYQRIITSASNEATKTMRLTDSATINKIKTIKVSMYLAGGTSTLLDEQIIPIISDGKDGVDGKDGASGLSVKDVYPEYLFLQNDEEPMDWDNYFGWTAYFDDVLSQYWESEAEKKYIWSRERVVYCDGSTSVSERTCQSPAAAIAAWCKENDITQINGDVLVDGSITAAKLATNALQSTGYYGGEDADAHGVPNNGEGAYSKEGTLFDVKNGAIYAPNFWLSKDGVIHAQGADIMGDIHYGSVGGLRVDNGIKGNLDGVETFSLTSEGLRLNSESAKLEVGNLAAYYDSANNTAHLEANGPLCIQGMRGGNAITSINFMTEQDNAEPVFANIKIVATNYVQTAASRFESIDCQFVSDATLYNSYTHTIYYQFGQASLFGVNWNDPVQSCSLSIPGGQSQGPYRILKPLGDSSGITRVRFGIVEDLTYSTVFNLNDGSLELPILQTYQTKTNETIRITGNFVPTTGSDKNGTAGYNLGDGGYYWNTIYARTGQIDNSDENKKNTIQSLSDVHSQIFDALQPVSYKFNVNNNNRTHIGFRAQDVKRAVESAGLTTNDFAAYCEWTDKEGNVSCGLRYSEFIAMCVNEIQKLKKHVAELEAKLND